MTLSAVCTTPACFPPPCSTGKERDTESGNDYFEARYYSSTMGRFMSPDWSAKEEPVPYAKLDDPQSLNLYDYLNNNPLVGVDPEGHAVQLLPGKDYSAQEELHQFQVQADNREAAERLYVNNVKVGDSTVPFVGVKGDLDSFAKLSPAAADIARLVKDPHVIEFGLTKRDLSKFGGAATFGIGEDGGSNKNVRSLVNPVQSLDMAGTFFSLTAAGQARFGGQLNNPAWVIRPLTVGIVMWHEFGHAWASVHGDPNFVGGETNSSAHEWENKRREQLYGPIGPNNAPRRVE